MSVKEIVKDEMLVQMLWGKKITLADGSVFPTLQKYLETAPEGRAFLALRGAC